MTSGDSGSVGRRRRRPDPVAATRQASAAERDEWFYARKRAQQRRQREQLDRAGFDPAPPDDDDWTVGAETGDALRRIRAPERVGSALGSLVARRGWQHRLDGATVWSRWPEIVGEDLAGRCEPARLHDGVLTVRAESSQWAAQLRYLTTTLQDRTNSALAQYRVKRVEIVVGALEGRARDASAHDARADED